MHTVNLVLYVIAATCFAIAVKTKHYELIALGLLAWVLVPGIATLRAG